MSKTFGNDMTTGSIPRHLLKFSLPMLIGNLIQTLYTLVDTIWVGQTVGANAVGAASVSTVVIFLLIALASGATIATTILVSQYYGAKDMKMVEKVVNNSFVISLIMGAFLTLIGLLACDPLLRMMNTPAEQFDLASSYLKINIAGFILMYFGQLITSILRGIGDTVTPLIFLAIGTIINAGLDPVLIIGIGPFPKLGLNGAAYASLFGQFIATALALIYLNRKSHIVSISPKKFVFDKHITLTVFKIGFPSMIQQSLVSIGIFVISSFVNNFGAVASSAFGAANKVDNLAFMPALSMGMACSALAGQNLGAGKPERVKEIFKWGMLMTITITVAISAIAFVIPDIFLRMFVKELEVIDIGIGYLRIVGASYVLFAMMFISNGIINGAGHTFITMIFTLISLWGIRVPFSAILSKTELGIHGIWISMVLSFAITTTISLLYYRTGRWKKAVIRKHRATHAGESTQAPAEKELSPKVEGRLESGEPTL